MADRTHRSLTKRLVGTPISRDWCSLDRLELLERLLAARAVTERAARRRAEDVLERRVARPRVVLDHAHVGLRAERRHRLLERALHRLERRAAEERRRELHADVSV